MRQINRKINMCESHDYVKMGNLYPRCSNQKIVDASAVGEGIESMGPDTHRATRKQIR